MIEIEIDGNKIKANLGEMIIQATDRNKIYIPRFCYHKKLSIVANCRMCLVEVEGSHKTLPACATPVAENMKVHTKSDEALRSQRAVMEFLLINHPLDCPICDQGGECELQDIAMGFGEGVSQYTERKRSIKDKNLGPLISSDMTRCILCTRCVRFGEEVAGIREFCGTGRGEKTEIGTYIQHAVKSEMSSNVIDLCPVGALTDKVYRFHGRAWEMRQHEAVAPHDCIGSNIYLHTRGEEFSPRRTIRRVVPRDNETINETWIADRDRYGVFGLNSDERLTVPVIKRNGCWEEVSWPVVLNFVVEGLKKLNPDKIGALASPNSTVEEFYLLQKLLRGMGSHNIDHRIREMDFRDQNQSDRFPGLSIDIADIENLDAALLVGSYLRHEQPIANTRLRKITLANKPVSCINPIDYTFNYKISTKIIVAGNALVHALAAVANALLEKKTDIPADLQKLIQSVKVEAEHKQIARQLKSSEKSAIFLGAYARQHPHAAIIRTLSYAIATLTDTSVNELTDGANTTGAWLAGAIPHRACSGESVKKMGLDAQAMFTEQLSGYLLLGIEPEFDCISPGKAIHALESSDIVVMLTPFMTQSMRHYADVLLPIAPFTENDGHFINVAGTWQENRALTIPTNKTRPAWKVLRVLGNLLKIDGFDYTNVNQIYTELKNKLNQAKARTYDWFIPGALPMLNKNLQRIGTWPIYRVDNIVRRAESLQEALPQKYTHVRINTSLAKTLQLSDDVMIKVTQKDDAIHLPVFIDNTIPDNFVVLPLGLKETKGFGEAYAEIKLLRLSC